MPYPRRLFPNFLGYEGAPGSKRTLDLINDPWFGEIRVQDLPGPDGRSLADGQPMPSDGSRSRQFGERESPLLARMVPPEPPTYRERTSPLPLPGEPGRPTSPSFPFGRNPAAARPSTATAAPTDTPGTLGSSGTLGRTASGTHPQDRATGGRPSLADGQALPPGREQTQPRGGFLSAIDQWARKPLFADGRSEGMLGEGGAPPMTRIGAIGQMLSAAAAGIGGTPAGGNWLGAGLAGAAGGLQQARKSEEERREKAYENEYRRLAMEMKRRELDKPADLIKTSPGDILLDPTTRQPVFTAPPKVPDVAAASNPFEAAWRSLPPEQQTMEMAQKLAEQEQARKDALSPAEQAREARAEDAARRAEESLQLSRQAGERAERAAARQTEQPTEATIKERDRRLVTDVAGKVESGGWESVPAEQRREYSRLWREMSTPRRIVDPATGTITEIQPDVTDLPVPPGVSGLTPGQGTAPAVAPPAAGAAPPGAAPLTPPPTPGVSTQGRVVGREQVQTAQDASRLYNEGTEAVDRVNELLDQAGATGRVTGSSAARLEQAASSLVSLLGAMGNSGVLQTGEVDRFKAELAGITGARAAAGAAVGYDPARAALEELKVRLRRHLENRLPKVSGPEEAARMPTGVPFLMPSGRVGKN